MRMRGGVCTVRWAVSLVKFGCRRRSGIQLLNSDSSGSNCFARASHFSDHLCLKTSNPFAPTVYLDLLHVEEVREETVKKLCGTLISPSTIAAAWQAGYPHVNVLPFGAFLFYVSHYLRFLLQRTLPVWASGFLSKGNPHCFNLLQSAAFSSCLPRTV